MRVPTIEESITEVTLSQWLKADGEYVELNDGKNLIYFVFFKQKTAYEIHR